MTFHGILPAVTTPFDDALAPDLEALASNLEQLIASGIHGVVGTGTMGESGSLSRDERSSVLRTIVEACDGRVPVVAGIAAATPEIAVGYVRDAKQVGVAGFMVLPPLLYNGDDREITGFYREVCDAAELPVIAYNNPHAAGYDLSAELVVALGAEFENLVQVKECSGDVRRIAQIIADSHGTLGVLVGGDDWAFEGLCVGAQGWISGVAGPLARECVELYDLIERRELDEAQALYARLLPMARFDMTPKLVQYYKAGMDEVGLAGGPSRPPRMALTAGEQHQLREALALVRTVAAA